jgi:hypothetical protein
MGLITVLASQAPSIAPYLFGTVVGFVIGALGHLMKAPMLIGLGIVMIVVTTALFVITTSP